MREITDIVLLKKCYRVYITAHLNQNTGMYGMVHLMNTILVTNLNILKKPATLVSVDIKSTRNTL